MTHIVWDWNGTLLADLDVVISASNEVFGPYGIGPLGVTEFRAIYTRPIWVAYERLLGRSLKDGEWERLDQAFHDHYHRLMEGCGLASGAAGLLQRWVQQGRTQSLLSMWRHDLLLQWVHRMRIAERFVRVDGVRTASGGCKAEHMVAHIAALPMDPPQVVVIGDSVDDADAAVHVGARAVLYAGGMQGRADLAATGFPVVDTLEEALIYATEDGAEAGDADGRRDERAGPRQ